MLKLGQNAVILGIPPMAFALSASGRVSLEFSRAFWLQWYGIGIYLCCYLVLWEEYNGFFDVHKRKSLLADTLLLTASSLGLGSFTANATATDLNKAFLGLDVFLGSACVWQVYTMLRNNYFESEGGWISWVRPAKPLSIFQAPVGTLHRDEYRYWLLGDGSQVVIITFVLVFYPSFLRTPPHWLRLLIIVGGTLGQLYNVWRYQTVRRRVATQSPPWEQYSRQRRKL